MKGRKRPLNDSRLRTNDQHNRMFVELHSNLFECLHTSGHIGVHCEKITVKSSKSVRTV